MSKILNDTQCRQIKAIRKKINALGIEGWMCEGTDTPGYCANIFFNNELDESFIADYSGKIVSSNTKNIDWKLLEFARLEGQIATICYG